MSPVSGLLERRSGAPAPAAGSLALLVREPSRLLDLGEEEWRETAEQLRWEGVLPLVLRRLQRAGRETGGSLSRWADLDRRLARYRAVAEVQERELERVLDLLAPVGVPPVLLKGVDLAYRCYPSPYLRPRADTDLYFEDLAKAEEAQRRLLSAGYESQGAGASADPWDLDNHLDALKAPATGCLVEIHGELLFAARDRRVSRTRCLLQGLEPTTLLGRPARVLAPEANLVYLMAHASGFRTGETFKLLAFADAAQLLERFGGRLSWERVCQLARESGFAGAACEGLLGAADVFGAAVPGEVLSRLREMGGEKRPPLSPESRVGQEALAQIRHARSPWSAGRIAWQILFPGAAHLREKDPGHAHLPVPLLYLRRWGRQARTLARLARESRGGSKAVHREPGAPAPGARP